MPTWTTTERGLTDGRRGTLETLDAMSTLASKGSSHPAVIEAAHDAVRGAAERNDIEAMRALLTDVRRRMRYTHDPLDTELVKAPEVVVQRSGNGPEPMDCDDASTLLASYLGAVGIPSRFVVVATNRSAPKTFSHVYVEALDTQRKRWVPIDPIMRAWDVGQAVPTNKVFRRETYMVGLGGSTMRGIGCANCPQGMAGGGGPHDFRGDVRGAVRIPSVAVRPALAGGDADRTDGVRTFAGLGGVVDEWVNPFSTSASNPVFSVGPITNGKAVLVLAGAYLVWKKFLR